TVALLAHGALLACDIAGVLPTAALAGLLSLPLSLRAAGLLAPAGNDVARLADPIRLTIAAATVHGVALAIGLVLG
ncbi:hypothetical protein, partial [Vibrio vulnificus]|uniref:hypothetical protein n=1 Tax=Vibrio vulnificus TaxID=672 RepID=UPI0039B5E507